MSFEEIVDDNGVYIFSSVSHFVQWSTAIFAI